MLVDHFISFALRPPLGVIRMNLVLTFAPTLGDQRTHTGTVNHNSRALTGTHGTP
jgi:hypothetical protein